MGTLLTISVIIEVGKVSTYLAANSNSKGALFGKRLASPNSPVTIMMATDALNWGNTNPSDTTLRGTANYSLWLDGRYGLDAQYIISGSGGGAVIPVRPGNLPLPIQFVVTASSFMIDGQSTATITSFIGFNLLFTRGGITQSTVNTQPSYYSWDRDTGLFTCTPAAVGVPTVPIESAELFQFYAIS